MLIVLAAILPLALGGIWDVPDIYPGDGICPQPKNEYNTPNYCEEGQISCSGGWDVLIKEFNGVDYKIGCKADDICYDTKRDQCSTFYCPATCVPEAGEYFCPHGDDVNGCPMGPGSCTYRTGEETCPPLCRPRCDWEGGHTLCPHGEDSNGCSLGHHCAFTCDCLQENTMYKGKALGGKIENIGSAYECQRECQNNEECEFFTWNSGTGPGKWNKKNANTCWLKKGLGTVKADCGKKCDGKVSGPKNC